MSLDNLVDKRGGFRRGKRFGWQTAKAIFDNIFLLRDAVRNMFDATGYPNTRELPRIRATYSLQSGDLKLDGAGDRTNRMPATLTKLGTGTYLCKFKTALPSADYDIQLTSGLQNDGRATAASYGNKFAGEFELRFCMGQSFEDPQFVTITIGWTG